ncbi:MAG: ribose-phosphate pyrophosphokinase [Chloroflexota bacterium]|nr:MAG: ribose-phosphate pyrophosphokinase [Chloroflexota bacterium]
MLFEKLSIFCGNAHPALASAICDHLGMPLGRADVFEFSNENIFVRILDHVRQHDVFIVQPTSSPVQRSIMELLIMIDALKRASAGRITAVVPYFGYARTDKKDQPRVPITARLIADLITVAGANRVLTMDLHAGQIQGFFSIPVDELTALYTLSRYFIDKQLRNPVVVAADEGIVKRARNFADRLEVPLAIVEKRRTGEKVQVMNVIGDVAGKQAIIIDDEVDTAGSLVKGTNAILQSGASEVYAAITHGVLSGPAIERLSASPLKELVITDTIPLPPQKRIPILTSLSVAPLIAETIRRIHVGEPVGELYDKYK